MVWGKLLNLFYFMFSKKKKKKVMITVMIIIPSLDRVSQGRTKCDNTSNNYSAKGYLSPSLTSVVAATE